MVASLASSLGPLAAPHLRLFTDTLLVASESGRTDEERTLPVLALSFDYAGTRIRSTDDRHRFFVQAGGSTLPVQRDAEREAAARRELERGGAVELGCLEGYEASFGSPADYLVAVEGDANAYCAFTQFALNDLRARGFSVEVDRDYPFRLVEQDSPWFLSLEPIAGRPNWFDFEMGVELDGVQVSLLDALLRLLEEVGSDSDLERLSRGSLDGLAVPVSSQRYVRLPRALASSLLEVLRELYPAGRRDGQLSLHRHQGLSVDALTGVLRAAGSSVRQRGPCVGKPGATLRRRDLAAAPSAPHGLRATLRPYQSIGLSWMQELRRLDLAGVLADDMGLGKTLQTIAHLCVEHARSEVQDPSLVVVPTSLIQNWRRELSRFAPHLRVVVWHGAERRSAGRNVASADVIITSYSLMVRESERFGELQLHYLILDEAQAIKNPRSAARAAACSLSPRHRLCLSGTPVENHLGDLWSLFDFLLPGLLGDAARFQASYRTPIEREGNVAQLETLRRVVAPFILRRTKGEVARDLPEKRQIVHPVTLSGDQRQLYESIRVAAHADVRRVVRAKGIAGSTIAILDALMKLRQVCCDPQLVRVRSARRVALSAKRQAFFRLLQDQLAEGRRVLVFSQFTSMLEILAAGLDQRGIDYLTLTGATQDRQAKVDAFERGLCDVFFISLKAGGTGLNLTSADSVIHYDPWWNPAAQMQATDRAHRIGQKRPVTVHQLIVSGSVEQRMLELQRRKAELATGLVGAAPGAPAVLSERELSDLFSPLES